MTTSPIPSMFQLDDRTDLSQLVAVMSLGLCTAIASGSVTIEEAERRLFNPKMLSQLTNLGIADSLLEIIHLGTELEDIQSLMPDKLAESLTQIQAKSLTFLNQSSSQVHSAA
jgi:hypothetical protein